MSLRLRSSLDGLLGEVSAEIVLRGGTADGADDDEAVCCGEEDEDGEFGTSRRRRFGNMEDARLDTREGYLSREKGGGMMAVGASR